MNTIIKSLLALSSVGLASTAMAAVSAGGLAVIGYDDHLDSVTLVATETIAANEIVYLTNNGWSTSQGRFNGADTAQGAGIESIIKLSFTSAVAPGTVLSTSTSGPGWVWTASGLIPGQIGGLAEFSDLALDYVADQIYIFQAAPDNPLLNPTNFIYALHVGSVDNPVFSDASDENSGGLPPGLSLSDRTALALSDLSAHGDPDGNHSAWGIQLGSPGISSLQAISGGKGQWLAAISSPTAWGAGSVPPTTHLAIHAPEPGRGVLLALAGMVTIFRRRR